MDVKTFNILDEKENSLFKRKEVKASIDSEITPNHKEVLKLISEKFSSSEENIKIQKISGKFGSQTFTITANIYSSKEDKEKTEKKSKKEKKE